MLGLTTNPNFQLTPFVFLLYSVDPIYGEPDESMETPVNQRVVRYTDKDSMADSASRLPILGGGEDDGIPVCFNTHAIGSIKFGHDGSLLITAGEGAHWDFDLGDFGQDLIPTDIQCEQKFGALQDVGSFRSQILSSLGGKLLRIDPGTGQGICQGNTRILCFSFFQEVVSQSRTHSVMATPLLPPPKSGLQACAILSV
jgi:hypothetical protein